MYFLIEIKVKDNPFYYSKKEDGSVIKCANPFFGKKYKTAARAQIVSDSLKPLFADNASVNVVCVDNTGTIKPLK